MKLERHEQSVEMRLAEAEDAEAIASVLLRAFQEFEFRYTPGGFSATTPKSPQILIRLQEGPVWVALVENSVAATVSVVHIGASLYVRGMAVLPAARGRGLGYVMLKRAQDFAIEHHCERMFLSTTPFLDRAIRLYEDFGFRRSDEGPQDLFGTLLFTMEKIL